MSSTGSGESKAFVRPRPGVVKALGICNVVFSVMTAICVFSSTFWWYYATMSQSAKVEIKVAPTKAAVAPTGPQPMVAYNPFMGMDDPTFLRFSLVDAGTSLLFNGIMFATGIGLMNLKRWGARWWTYLAYVKITRLVLLWGFFIVAVAPSLSESMARSVIAMIPQGGGRGGGPTIADFARIYSIMCLVLGASVIVVGSIYPAVSLWLIGRPGVQAALVDKTPSEPKLT